MLLLLVRNDLRIFFESASGGTESIVKGILDWEEAIEVIDTVLNVYSPGQRWHVNEPALADTLLYVLVLVCVVSIAFYWEVQSQSAVPFCQVLVVRRMLNLTKGGHRSVLSE